MKIAKKVWVFSIIIWKEEDWRIIVYSDSLDTYLTWEAENLVFAKEGTGLQLIINEMMKTGDGKKINIQLSFCFCFPVIIFHRE